MSAIPEADWDTIEAVALTLATYGCFPVKLCRVNDHTHKDKTGADRPCHTPGKRPVESHWEQGNRETNLAQMDAWKAMGFMVGNVIVDPLVGLDGDLVPDGMVRWFEEQGESIPHTLGDVVPTTGKSHLIVLRRASKREAISSQHRGSRK